MNTSSLRLIHLWESNLLVQLTHNSKHLYLVLLGNNPNSANLFEQLRLQEQMMLQEATKLIEVRKLSSQLSSLSLGRLTGLTKKTNKKVVHYFHNNRTTYLQKFLTL